jgi:hypothetical protein
MGPQWDAHLYSRWDVGVWWKRRPSSSSRCSLRQILVTLALSQAEAGADRSLGAGAVPRTIESRRHLFRQRRRHLFLQRRRRRRRRRSRRQHRWRPKKPNRGFKGAPLTPDSISICGAHGVPGSDCFSVDVDVVSQPVVPGSPRRAGVGHDDELAHGGVLFRQRRRGTAAEGRVRLSLRGSPLVDADYRRGAAGSTAAAGERVDEAEDVTNVHPFAVEEHYRTAELGAS